MVPIFMTKQLRDTGFGKCVGQYNKHLRIGVYKNNEGPINSIGFGLGDKLELIQNKALFNIAYSIEESQWNSHVSLQLKINDIKA